MTSDCPPVSVIVPVYNVERYLEACLDAIAGQTFQGMEIILVNDGSTDRSPDIINAYAAKDKRIVTVSQPNRGVSAARNAGLSVATGEYILFVDSDDFVRNDTVERFYRQAMSTGAEIIMGNYNYCYPDGKQAPHPDFRRMAEFGKLPVMTGEQCFAKLMEEGIFPPLVYLYFCKRAFIMDNRLFFEEGIIHEDELWCLKTLVHAKQVSVSLLDYCHYFYRLRQGSIIRSNNKKYRIDSYFAVVGILETFVSELQERKMFMQATGWIQVRFFYFYDSICKLMPDTKEERDKYREYFERKLKQIRPELTHAQQQACLKYFRDGSKLLFTRSRGLTLSFCITCKNRFHQISQTLPQNLEDNKDAKDVIEFVLVDFGSTDGLQEWVAANFSNEIAEGYLTYCYTEELPSWHTSIAKNTSHLLANNAIVVNLDCDNFTGKDGGLFVIDRMLKYGWNKTILHQFGNDYADGSCGRIALSKYNFLMLGGYDERFEPAGYQDIDLLLRAQLMNLNCLHFPDKAYNRALVNTHEEEIAFVDSKLSWDEMEARNRQLSFKNITSGKIKANTEKEHIGIIDNIYTF